MKSKRLCLKKIKKIIQIKRLKEKVLKQVFILIKTFVIFTHYIRLSPIIIINIELLVIWSKSATLLFLTLYQEYAPEIENGKCNRKTVFQKISQKLTENEFIVSAKQCMTKLTTMKRMYKKIKDHNSKSGNDRQTWSYYEVSINILSLW